MTSTGLIPPLLLLSGGTAMQQALQVSLGLHVLEYTCFRPTPGPRYKQLYGLALPPIPSVRLKA